MQILPQHRRQMESIIEEMKADRVPCSRDYECYTSSLEKLCKVKHIGCFDEMECESKNAACCGHSFAALSNKYCSCPLRRYIAEHFHR